MSTGITAVITNAVREIMRRSTDSGLFPTYIDYLAAAFTNDIRAADFLNKAI